LSEEEIIRIYGIRWDIETFFKCTKSLLRLQKEFQGRSYDLLISHTTIVFARYILLTWQQRCNTGERTLGGLFMCLADELNELDWAIALTTLLDLLSDISSKFSKKVKKYINCQLRDWFAGLPNYIKVYLPNHNIPLYTLNHFLAVLLCHVRFLSLLSDGVAQISWLFLLDSFFLSVISLSGSVLVPLNVYLFCF
jgi:hypothetical protein